MLFWLRSYAYKSLMAKCVVKCDNLWEAMRSQMTWTGGTLRKRGIGRFGPILSDARLQFDYDSHQFRHHDLYFYAWHFLRRFIRYKCERIRFGAINLEGPLDVISLSSTSESPSPNFLVRCWASTDLCGQDCLQKFSRQVDGNVYGEQSLFYFKWASLNFNGTHGCIMPAHERYQMLHTSSNVICSFPQGITI